MEEEAKRAVKVRLVCERAPSGPGSSGTLALVFEIASHWHIYWRNAGDTGLPISVEFEAPAGVKIGPAQWPAPMRLVSPGEILDYVYENSTALFFPIEFSSNAASPVTIRAHVDWLVCREACVPGSADVSLTLPGAPLDDSEAKRVAQARARVPRPANGSGATVRAVWRGLELNFESPGATSLTFFPYESDEAQAINLLERGVANGHRLSIGYAESVRSADRVRGVLEVRREGPPLFVLIDEPPPGSE